ncbi:prenyltransferase/squalene oxidase repeat-containing protein [Streptomyces sp. YIM S03343]
MPETGSSAVPPTPETLPAAAARPPSAAQPTAAGSPLSRAEQFVWLTARVLEQRLFAHFFLDGGPDPVERALDAYRNEDGGYGHALEPDLRGPVSQPLHTAHALRVLDAIGRCGGRRVERVCGYLTAVSTPDGALPAVHPSQRGYPAAPFVPILSDPPGELLATGPVVGLLHRNEVWHAWLFRATDFCWQAVESPAESHPYEVEAAVAFLDAVPDRPRAQAAADRLGRLVRERRLAALDPEHLDEYPVQPGYAPGEHHFPHDFARTPDSLARAWFTDAEMTRSLDFLARDQQEDGGWPVRRRQWAPAPALEARPLVTIEALRTLRAYGRPVG